MLDILLIRDHAQAAADEGKSSEACPFAVTSRHGLLWLDYYYSRVMWLSGELSA